MRLTLRTMLAYMDNVLEPNESEELGRKIRESKFAGDLVHQIRTVASKVRMDAPKLDGKGMGHDANTVSEYLDSALPQDRVGDFERVCLESNKHLAEVAGCHQILTLVLGKPADVPDGLRERIYALGHSEAEVESPPVAAAKLKSPLPVKADSNGHPAIVTRPVTDVPDYLKAGRSGSIWQFLGTLAAVFLLAALVLRLMGPFNNAHPVLALFKGATPVADANRSTASPATPTDRRLAGEQPEAGQPKTGAATGSQGETASKSGESTASDSRPPAPDAGTPVASKPVEPGSVEPTADPTADPTGAAGRAREPMPEPPAIPPVPDVAAGAKPEPTPKPLPDGPDVPKPALPKPEPVAMDVGRFLSDEQVLAHQVKDDGMWLRVPARSVLSAGEQLISLPAFRPQIALASGVQVTFAGESAVQLAEPVEKNSSRMKVGFGRLMLVTVGAAGARVELDLGGVRGVVTLVDADSAVAVSVKKFLPPGTDPDSMPPFPVVEIFNTYGRVTWEESGQPRVEIPTGQVRIYAGDNAPDNYGPFASPDWIDPKSIAPIDRESQIVLERLLVEDKALNLSLAEALEHRQVNVRSLAARCLAVLGEFEPILNELNDPRQQAFWSGEFVTLRNCIQRGPDVADRLKDALGRAQPDQAAELYRLLWGYSEDQLAKDEAVNLVKLLESDHMDVRVLAIQNLVAITGAMEFYRAEKKPEDVRAAIQAWRSRLAKKTITYKVPPAAIEAYKPLDRPPGAAARVPAPKGAVGPIDSLQSDSKWYQGGTLHNATMKEWRAATTANKLATAADLMLTAFKGEGGDPAAIDFEGALRPAALGLVKSLDAANKDGVIDNQSVSEAAAVIQALFKAELKK